MKKLPIFLTLLAFLASCAPKTYTCPTYAGLGSYHYKNKKAMENNYKKAKHRNNGKI